eukprot:CAMPEP_0168556994 /NCGR_PEP_ID=MMETSP0413-20121227/9181_1 /TAXON_ID=136452 /ORGANISM="Filamoeba nolandi, Strain NC-AS-23-1" /LENGTH=228 /DNA_ID=CAMNT_0008587981 /DNA_START=350 /DNA_END=1035 /DNA_ORIENTATION=-
MATFQDEDDYLDGVGSDEEVVESIPDDAMIYVYKILVVGDSGTGKTSIINRYTKNEFPQNYKATVGVDFAVKSVQWDKNTVVRLQLWDIAGQERFSTLSASKLDLDNAKLLLSVVYDLANDDTLTSVTAWKRDLDENLPVILLANKCDLTQQRLDRKVMDAYCTEHGFLTWFETSAKNNINLDESGKKLIQFILLKDPKTFTQKPKDTVDLKSSEPPKEEEKKCCTIV